MRRTTKRSGNINAVTMPIAMQNSSILVLRLLVSVSITPSLIFCSELLHSTPKYKTLRYTWHGRTPTVRFTLSPKMAHFDLEITPSGTTVRVVGDAAQEMHDAARGLQTATSELVLAAREQFPNFDEHLRDALARREEWAHAWRDALIRAMLHSAAPRVLCTAPAGAATVLDAYTLQADGLVLDLAGSGLCIEQQFEYDMRTGDASRGDWLTAGDGPLGVELTPEALREFVQAAAEVAA